MSVLFLGNITCDILLYMEHLPHTEDDLSLIRQSMQIGGCAFNACNVFHVHQEPYRLLSPIGSGIYGDYLTKALKQLGYRHRLRVKGEQGCCYCLIDAKGERTFLANHGSEYDFSLDWLNPYKHESFDAVYVCGIDLAERSGAKMVEALKMLSVPIFLAPGPLALKEKNETIEQVMKLQPIVHLNEPEALHYTGCKKVEKALYALHEKTQQTVVITLGAKGAIAIDHQQLYHAPAIACNVVDTVGAGDVHAGALLMHYIKNKDIQAALAYANQMASIIVGKPGALLEKDDIEGRRA